MMIESVVEIAGISAEAIVGYAEIQRSTLLWSKFMDDVALVFYCMSICAACIAIVGTIVEAVKESNHMDYEIKKARYNQ